MKYLIELTEEQMRVTEKALNMYMRLLMGQDYDFSDEIVEVENDWKQNKDLFDRAMMKRDDVRDVMQAVFKIAFGSTGVPNHKTIDMEIAECLWDSIRFARGRSRWDSPFHIGPEPCPKIEKVPEV